MVRTSGKYQQALFLMMFNISVSAKKKKKHNSTECMFTLLETGARIKKMRFTL